MEEFYPEARSNVFPWQEHFTEILIFLVLDEAFNGLDDTAIDKILSNLTMYLMPHQKIILISHSAAHLTKVDLMLQLDSDGIKVENRPAQI